MPSTIDIRRRIRSVKNSQQITKAMKMVAAAKLRRAQERMFAARPYAAGLRKVLASVATRVDIGAHPLLQSREPERNVVVIVVTADRGLCGAFNANVIRAAQNFIRESAFESVSVLTIGRKGGDYFKRRPIPVRQNVMVAQALSLGVVHEIAESLIKDFIEEKIDGVYVVYNEFKSIIAQDVRAERLLPIIRDFEDTTATDQGGIDYLYEPGPEQILSDLLPKHIEFQLYRVLLESAAAEQGARMTAMEAATKNASDMIEYLTLTYNRIRQAAITKEIIEIVSGASAAQ
ncbi:MAG: F-type H+-transporting ATPase subunit gamma [Thermoanaerobaculia bacterium]|jgi:F-type H+-transporting ATPase subunit gamma|nr:F-type H+-transporting ATPase subunit gamma [Thermoanaerobaculia bacterium]